MSADLPTSDHVPAAPLTSATVLVVDDHPVLRHGLVALLEVQDWVSRVVEAGTCGQAERAAVLLRPELAVIDLGLPDGRGADLIAQLRRTVPDCICVVLTMTRDEDSVSACLRSGARGYLLKDSPPDVLVSSLRIAAAGGTILGRGVGGHPLGQEPSAAVRPPLTRLGPRDLTVLRLLAEGNGTAEIARRLGVSEKTVRNRLSTIYATIGVSDRVQAVLMAQRKGLGGPHPRSPLST